MEKRIVNFEDYGITDDGKVISYKYKIPKVLKTWYQASGYENIKLCKNNKTEHFLIHRLVAEAFIPNPNNYPEVNHIDGNPKNNYVSNLEWCDRKYNLEQTEIKFRRNFRECLLINQTTNEVIGHYSSVRDACKDAELRFGCSSSYMAKSYSSKGYKIQVLEGVETKLEE